MRRGLTDPFDLFTEVRKYQVRDVAGRITTPLLITGRQLTHTQMLDFLADHGLLPSEGGRQ